MLESSFYQKVSQLSKLFLADLLKAPDFLLKQALFTAYSPSFKPKAAW